MSVTSRGREEKLARVAAKEIRSPLYKRVTWARLPRSLQGSQTLLAFSNSHRSQGRLRTRQVRAHSKLFLSRSEVGCPVNKMFKVRREFPRQGSLQGVCGEEPAHHFLLCLAAMGKD